MKKLLSIVLISAMVLALVPSAFATTTETDTSNLVRAYNFDFGAAGYAGIDGQTGETEIGYDTLRDYGDTKTVAEDGTVTYTAEPTTWATTNTDPWVVDGNYRCIESSYPNVTISLNGNMDNGDKKTNSLYWCMLGTRAWKNGSPEQAGSVAIRLKIDKPGTYTPKLTYNARKDLAKYDVYLVPYYLDYLNATLRSRFTFSNTNLTGAVLTQLKTLSSCFLGQVDMYAETEMEIPLTLNSYTISEKDLKEANNEFVLVFYPNGLGNTLASQYASKNGPAQHVNLFSFELYREKTTEEKAAEESFDASVDEDETVTNSASVELLKYNGEKSKSIGSVEDVTYGKSVTIPAVDKTYTDEETGKTYNFLYWAKGLEEGVSKQILSTSYESFPYKPHAGVNYLIAVYEEAGNAKEAFYNKNGQLLTDLGIKDNKLPALPAMAGRGDAIKWVQRGTDAEFDGGADAPTTGDKVFMAKYNEPTEGSITINGKNYFYGDTISCKDIVDSTENFSYFTRQIGNGEAEIISIDPDYSFSAYTDCEISAVCNGAVTLTTPRKIALSTFSVGENLTAVMAEFIGFGDAKEKGIMFGNKKIAMTTDKAQFTVTNDTEDDVVVTGYAIVGDDKYVDGEITVAGTTSAE